MAIQEPHAIPAGREHLGEEERALLEQVEVLVSEARYAEAQELTETLWREAFDAHKELYRGLTNALTAVVARERGQERGARQIAAASHVILDRFPAQVLGLDLTLLLSTIDAFLAGGQGPVRLSVTR